MSIERDIPRRDFLKAVAGGLASGFLSGEHAFAEDLPPEDRQKNLENIFKSFSEKGEDKIPGAEKIEQSVMPEKPFGCIILLRQIHLPPFGDKRYSEKEFSENEGTLTSSNFNNLRLNQTGIFSIVNWLRQKEVKEVYQEGWVKEYRLEKFIQQKQHFQEKVESFKEKMSLLKPLAEKNEYLWKMNVFTQAIKDKPLGKENPVFKDRTLDELKGELKELKTEYDARAKGLEMEIVDNKQKAGNLLETYKSNYEKSKQVNNVAEQSKFEERIKLIEETLNILKNEDGSSAQYEYNYEKIRVKNFQEKEHKTDQILDSGLLSMSRLAKNRSIDIIPAEDKETLEQTIQALEAGKKEEVKKLQKERETKVIEAIANNKACIAPLIFGGDHKEGFIEAVQQYNKQNPDKPYALITVTPTGYPKD